MLFYKINVGVSPAVPIKKGFLCFLIDEVEKKTNRAQLLLATLTSQI
jgi:hypothetical protein